MHRILIAHESIRLSQSELKSVNFNKSTVLDDLCKRKVEIFKAKVRSTYDPISMFKKEPSRNQWIRIIAKKEFAGIKLRKPILEQWKVVSAIRNLQSKCRKDCCDHIIPEVHFLIWKLHTYILQSVIVERSLHKESIA